MSPIGRIFIVVNLLLAGTFVGFAGTYLQQATNFKKLYDDEVVAHEADNKAKDALYSDERDKANDESRKLASSEQNLSNEKSERASLQKENERLSAQFAAIQADLKSTTSSIATMSSSVESASNNAEVSRKAALQHLAEKDAAVRISETATSDLADANNKISHLEGDVQARNASIAQLNDTIKEQGIMLAVFKRRYGDTFALAQPDLKGTVQHVGANGKLLTVVITDNPGENKIEKGYKFAIYAGSDYKGEATITEVDGNNAFCRFSGKGKVAVGDGAKTNLY